MIGRSEREERRLAAAPEEALLVRELVQEERASRRPRRSARGRRPRASRRCTSSPSSSVPAASASAVSSCRTRVGSSVQDDDRLAGPPEADLDDAVRRQELGGDPVATIAAVAQDREAVGELSRLLQVVGGQEDRLAELAQRRGSSPRPAGGRRDRIRSSARRGRRARDRRRARARGRGAEAGRPRASARARRASPRARRASITSSTGRAARVVAGEEREDLADGQRRIDSRRLEHDADPGPKALAGAAQGPRRGRAPRRPSVLGSPRGSRPSSSSGPVRAEEGEHLAGLDREVEPVEHLAASRTTCGGREPRSRSRLQLDRDRGRRGNGGSGSPVSAARSCRSRAGARRR